MDQCNKCFHNHGNNTGSHGCTSVNEQSFSMEPASLFQLTSNSFDRNTAPALAFYPVEECKGSIKDIVGISDDFPLCHDEDDPLLTTNVQDAEHFSSLAQGTSIAELVPLQSTDVAEPNSQQLEIFDHYGDGRHFRPYQEVQSTNNFEALCEYDPNLGYTNRESPPLALSVEPHQEMSQHRHSPHHQPHPPNAHSPYMLRQQPVYSQKDIVTVQEKAYIMEVLDHDVLSGRGMTVCQHPGNQRFRAIVSSRAGDKFDEEYNADEKRAVAMEIVAHMKSLHPRPRFLKRCGSLRNGKDIGLEGPFVELSLPEILVKTRQALRDCHRQALARCASPLMVRSGGEENLAKRTRTGLSNSKRKPDAVDPKRARASSKLK